MNKRGCSVKAYGDMIKKQAGGPVSMPDYRAAPTTTGVKMKNGGVQTSADTARKLATEMGGMKHGGKPVKKAKGGAGKVRKGMMSPSGSILEAVKPKRGMM